MAPAITARGKRNSRKFVPFFPHWVVTDTILGLGLLALLVYLSWSQGVPLDFPADPSASDFVPRPEWYFLFYFQALKYFPGSLEAVATILIPLFIFGTMIVLPFVDKGDERRPWKKPVTTGVGIFYTVLIIVLTILAW